MYYIKQLKTTCVAHLATACNESSKVPHGAHDYAGRLQEACVIAATIKQAVQSAYCLHAHEHLGHRHDMTTIT